MSIEADVADLRWGELDPLLVGFGIERAGDREPGAGAGFADETQDGGIINERLSRPVLADLGEEPMLDGIPLGSAGGIMTDGDEKPEGIDELFLQGVFPEVGVCAVAAAVVGEDEQTGGIRIAETAFSAQPPLADRCRGESRGVTRGADRHAAAIGLAIVDAVRDGDACAERREIVVENRHGCSAPDLAGILEPADQLALFGVDADDRRLRLTEAASLPGQIAELPIALGMA